MRFKASVIGNIKKDLQDFSERIERATTLGVRESAKGLQEEWRGQVRAAKLGRVANAVRRYDYPRSGYSKNAASVVTTKAPHIIAAYEKGSTIRARNGRFLAVPLPQAQRLVRAGGAGFRITPRLVEEWLDVRLFKVDRPGRNPILVARGARLAGVSKTRGGGNLRRLRSKMASKTMGDRTSLTGMVDIPMFVLIPVVKIPKRLALEPLAKKWGALTPSLISRNIKK